MNHLLFHAKWILAFNATLFLLLLLNSCSATTANTDATTTTVTITEQPINYMYIGDVSNRNNAAEVVNIEEVEDAIHVLAETNVPVSAAATHISYSPPQFANLSLDVVPPPPDKFALGFIEKEQKRQVVIDNNADALSLFRKDFQAKITDFELTPKTDYSYVNLHGRMLADFLRGDPSVASTKIAVWSSDLIDHPKGQQKGVLLSQETVTVINEAIASTNGSATLYVITTAKRKGTALDSLNATFASSFSQIKNSLKSNFPPAQK